MPQTKARARRQQAPEDLEKAIEELKRLLDMPMEARAPSWGERTRKLIDSIKERTGTDTLS